MPTEDLAAYQLHVKSFTDEYHPQGATEAHLVQSLADTAWRLNRVAALETNVLTLGVAGSSAFTDARNKSKMRCRSQPRSKASRKPCRTSACTATACPDNSNAPWSSFTSSRKPAATRKKRSSAI